MTDKKRTGARSTKDIPNDILEQLNHGEIETANVVEWFAIDRRKLLENVLLKHNRKKYLIPILDTIDNLEKQTSNIISEAIGTGLLKQTKTFKDNEFLLIISTHESDLVRSWGTFTVGKNTNLTIKEMFQKIQPFAADNHFNVREEAWGAVRPFVIQNLSESITLLAKWAINDDENIRRFASEVTRPRGVWCKHIDVLKDNPELALSILEPLKSDKSRYVQNSVGNWLNDASKTQPNFVIELCSRWEKENNSKETAFIVKKALRTINKFKNQET